MHNRDQLSHLSLRSLSAASFFWSPLYGYIGLDRACPLRLLVGECPATTPLRRTRHPLRLFLFRLLPSSLQRLGTGTATYAVDTWEGDEHAGFYGDAVYRTVAAHNRARYAGFSTLIRSTFGEACDYFDDGSVDLLHIDGLRSTRT